MNETEIFNALLEKGNKKQTEIAKEMGTTKQYVQGWKNGSPSIKLQKLHKIADFLDLTIEIKIILKKPTYEKNTRT